MSEPERMTQYKIYHKNTLLVEVTKTPQPIQEYWLNFCGIEIFDAATEQLLISCPIEDVKVEKNGVEVPLEVMYTYIAGEFITGQLIRPRKESGKIDSNN